MFSKELVEWLEELFPAEVPMTDSPVDYYRAQGRQQVIRKIKAEYRKLDPRQE